MLNPWSVSWRRYFRPRPFEIVRSGRLYTYCGVRHFKRYLPTSGDLFSQRRGIRRIAAFGPGLHASLVRHERFTRVYEGRHMFGALSMLVLSWWSIELHGNGNWPVLLVANMLINGYPIMLQRYNRVRVQAALALLTPRPRGETVEVKPVSRGEDGGGRRNGVA